jgi:chorismate mutase
LSPAQPTRCQGVRGAITVDANTPDAILAATREMLSALIDANGIDAQDVGGVFFTTTVDLNAEYPAVAARQLGWMDAAILCGHEMTVPGGLPRVVRVMVMWNTTRRPHEIQHVYLGDAQHLRPDRAQHGPLTEPTA